jgi:hypothetical protein
VVLVDTSVWVEHFQRGNRDLQALLEDSEVLCHRFVIGELACGSLKNRAEILRLLSDLPSIDKATDDELLRFIERHGLHGKGLGLIDMHLLASSFRSGQPVWTLDTRLSKTAAGLGVSYR